MPPMVAWVGEVAVSSPLTGRFHAIISSPMAKMENEINSKADRRDFIATPPFLIRPKYKQGSRRLHAQFWRYEFHFFQPATLACFSYTGVYTARRIDQDDRSLL